MIGLGIAWASMMGVPYIMVVSMVPKARYGVYMGIVNMMIVVPMLIQTVTFGYIYHHFLGSNPMNAMMFSGVLFLIGAVAMTWIRPPKKQFPVVPLTLRQIMGYNRVLVGSDGSESSLRAVERAAEVAEAGLVVACACNRCRAASRRSSTRRSASPGSRRSAASRPPGTPRPSRWSGSTPAAPASVAEERLTA